MRIVLTSSFPAEGNDAVFDGLKAMHLNPRIAWVPPRAEVGGKYFQIAREAFAKHGFEHLQAAALDELADAGDLNRAFDLIYLTGGDPIVFRDNALRTGLAGRLRDFLDRDGVVIGASGGAMLLTRNVALFKLERAKLSDALASHATLGALAFVDYEMLPHANRLAGAPPEELGGYARQVGCDVVALDDGAAVIHTTATDCVFLGKVTRYPGT